MEIRSRNILGSPVFAIDRGEKMGQVKDYVFHPEKKAIIALVIAGAKRFGEEKILPLGNIKSLGQEAITICLLYTSPLLLEQLVAVWESSVQATHLFLTAGEIAAIKQYVPAALKDVDHLLVAEDEGKKPVAFMGLSEPKLEMLFICLLYTSRCV